MDAHDWQRLHFGDGRRGFIGLHLVERLLADGKSVIVIDDCSTGRLENLRGCGRIRA